MIILLATFGALALWFAVKVAECTAEGVGQIVEAACKWWWKRW